MVGSSLIRFEHHGLAGWAQGEISKSVLWTVSWASWSVGVEKRMNTNEKIEYFTNIYLEDIQNKAPFYDQCAFKLGNCYLRKHEYELAQKYYKMSINSSFTPPKYWKDSGQANWLVNNLILSNEFQLLNKVSNELESFKEIPHRETWPVTFYALCVIKFIQGNADFRFWLEKLLSKQSVKESFCEGKAIQGIADHDESNFKQALGELLLIHDRQVKHGMLRETGEGLICMSGMSLVYLAITNGMIVDIINEYIVPDYFQNR